MNEWEVQDAARRVYRWAGLSLLLTFALQLLLGFLVGMLSVWMPESLVYPTALCLNTGASAAGALVLARMTGYSFRPKPYSLQALETWGWTAGCADRGRACGQFSDGAARQRAARGGAYPFAA